jgi:RHH-type proline utilization regulon transcriptional repressor/proline dehydrogenase/delta 1-pyrroline-5-carboxylate dehydrogenase
LPREVRDWLSELSIPVSLETDEQWLTRMAARGSIDTGELGEEPPVATRVRIVGPRPETVAEAEPGTEASEPEPLAKRLAEALGGDPEIAIWGGPVTQAGRVELLPFLREQAISITAHRFGNPDPWSQEII